MSGPTIGRTVRGLVDEAREFVTLDEFEERTRATEGSVKESIARELGRARELHRGADLLWEGGAPALALKLAAEAFQMLLAVAVARGPGKQADEARNLTKLGTDDVDTACIVGVDRALSAEPLPESDGQVLPAHAELFPQLRYALIALERLVEPYGVGPVDLARKRRQRRTRLAIVGTLAVIALVLLVISRFRSKAVASQVYSDKYEAMNVLDGNHGSEWLLPNGTLGWIDVQLAPPRTVHRLRLINAHNHEFLDRGTREFTIEVFSKGTKLATVDSSFPEFTANPKWTTVELGDLRKVDRIRITIKSYFLSGAGLGEVSVD